MPLSHDDAPCFIFEMLSGVPEAPLAKDNIINPSATPYAMRADGLLLFFLRHAAAAARCCCHSRDTFTFAFAAGYVAMFTIFCATCHAIIF